MATKKSGKQAPAKKKATKGDAPAKEKRVRVKKDKKPKVPYTPNADRIVYFMNSLIQAGYVGESIPEDSKERRVAAQSLRQMSQQLDRQVHKTTT